jgi:hypothetical protein
MHNISTAEVREKKPFFGNATYVSEFDDEQVTHDLIIPSICENDGGSLAFQNATWRKNINWRPQFATSPCQQPSSTLYRGLFGNLVLDVQQDRQRLNPIVFDTMFLGTKYFKKIQGFY